MASLRKQRGFAMILVMVMVAMGSTWMVLARLNQASTEITVAKRAHNAKVMTRAKEALIGYVAAQANKEGENNPGNLPCPENPGDFYNADSQYDWRQGVVGTGCGSSVKVGRFPWRTLGLEKLVDADGEALWYVVSPNWGGSNTVINSDTAGQLTVDGVANAAIALIIAPGAVINAQAASGCTAWNQARPTNATPDWRNYLECENATSPAAYAFVTTGPSGSFNDQVLAVTADDMLPALEASIANRIEREIVPVVKAVYTVGSWGIATGAEPVYPLPATFDNPGTASYRGMSMNATVASFAGLLPVNYVGCTEGSDPRCANSTFLGYSKGAADVQTGGTGSIRTQSTCSWSGSTYVCTGEYLNPSISVQVTVNVSNVAMGLRTIDTSSISCTAVDDGGGGIPQQTVPCTASVAMQSNGSLSITMATDPLPDVSASGWGTYANFSVHVPRAIFGDHAILTSTLGTEIDVPGRGMLDITWFMRNRWYRHTYYAVARNNTSYPLPGSDRVCVTSTDTLNLDRCLTVTSSDGARPITPTGGQRAILILAGRSMSGTSRPNSTLADYLENGNATGSFIREVISRKTFNDRVVVVSSN